jgi:addiction module RelE/StbE family toxin
MKLRWTRVALQDLRHLYEYIAEDNPSASSSMANRIQEVAQRLKKHPQMGKPGRVKGARELVIVGSPESDIDILVIVEPTTRRGEISQKRFIITFMG